MERSIQSTSSFRGLVNEYPEFLKLSTHRVHHQTSTIQHWQLRDMIACPNRKGEIFMTVNTGVKIYDINKLYHHQAESDDASNGSGDGNGISAVSWPIRDLMFSPSCMCAKNGYLAVGGQKGQLVVRHLPSSGLTLYSDLRYFFTQLGTAIINGINVHKNINTSRLIISSNDETIKVISLPTLQPYKSISMSMAVNFTDVSPDGKYMVAVGDLPKAYLFDTSNYGDYKKIHTISGSNDSAFSCSWNASSDKFAIACQDNCVCIWDIRKLDQKLAQLSTSQVSMHVLMYKTCIEKGACRRVHFTASSSVDLLLFSEHVNCINIVDARTFDALQTISIGNGPAHQGDKLITGIAFSPDTTTAYVGKIIEVDFLPGTDTELHEFAINTFLKDTIAAGCIF